jgi:hypothetical protein
VFSYGDETNSTFGGTVNYVTGAGSAQVVGRQTFYNNSAFDGGDPAATPGDDLAVDPGKQALLPGGTAGFGNITSYAQGINGITVDIKGLPSEVQLTLTDFAFRTGPRAIPTDWVQGPAPREVSVRRGAGIEGSDRITLVWPDYNPLDLQTRAQQAVANSWLEITVTAGARTGLLQPDVFYFGNLIGETNDGAQRPGSRTVNTSDYYRTRASIGTTAAIANPYDFNRDRKVDAKDLAVVRFSLGNRLDLLSTPSPVARPHPIATDPASVITNEPTLASPIGAVRLRRRPL